MLSVGRAIVDGNIDLRSLIERDERAGVVDLAVAQALPCANASVSGKRHELFVERVGKQYAVGGLRCVVENFNYESVIRYELNELLGIEQGRLLFELPGILYDLAIHETQAVLVRHKCSE